MAEKLYRVRAGDGLVISLPPGIVVDSPVRVLTHETIVTVREDRLTRRSLANGDFVLVEEEKAESGRSKPVTSEDWPALEQTPAGRTEDEPPRRRGKE